MSIDLKSGTVPIGEWTFYPASCELRRRDEVRRIEPRAAKALEVLCDAGGELVSQEQFVERVWDGRALSDNSVSVVIGQLRRALDDDAREPRILETIPKRGYRLRTAKPAEQATPASRGTRPWTMLVAMFILAVAGAWAFTALRSEPQLMIEVRDVANETGDPKYVPLARATSELIIDRLDARGFATRRSGGGDLRLQPKLIIWDEKPFLSMTATDQQGQVRWSAMLNASPGRVPSGVEEAFADLERNFPVRDGADRLAKREAPR